VDAVYQLLLALQGLVQVLLQNVLLCLVQEEVSPGPQPPLRPTREEAGSQEHVAQEASRPGTWIENVAFFLHIRQEKDTKQA
jgi:hypothetical protein